MQEEQHITFGPETTSTYLYTTEHDGTDRNGQADGEEKRPSKRSEQKKIEENTTTQIHPKRKCVMYRGAMDCCVFDRLRIRKLPQQCIFGQGSLYPKCTSNIPTTTVPSSLFSRIVHMWNFYYIKSEKIVCIHDSKLSKRSISCV